MPASSSASLLKKHSNRKRLKDSVHSGGVKVSGENMTDGLSSSHLGMVTIGFSQLDGKGAVIVSQEHETAL